MAATGKQVRPERDGRRIMQITATHRRWLAAAALALLGACTTATAGSPSPFDGYFASDIDHVAYERIVAGPALPPALGQTTMPPYFAADIALSGNGTRLWFVLYNHFESPRHQVWSINTDGTGALQSALGSTVSDPGTTLNGLFVRTDLDGDVAMLDSTTQFWRILGTGGTMELMFDLVGSNFALADGQQRVSDDGSLGVFLDRWQKRVFTVDLTALAPSASLLVTEPFFAYMSLNPRSLFGLDMSADGGAWYVAAENHFGDVGRKRYWVNRVAGVVSPARAVEDIGDDAQFVNRALEVSDDGALFGYCIDSQAEITARCFLQEPGSGTRLALTDGTRPVGGLVLADDGSRVYLLSDPHLATPYGYFQSADGTRRWLAGSQRLSGNPNPVFLRARLSDDGRVLAAPTAQGVYVLHDGMAPPPGFPRIEHVLQRYDPDSDELIVRALVVDAPDGIERIYTLPLWHGIEPTRHLPEALNPLWNERNGGGVNWSTVFAPVEGLVGWYERRIPLQGKLRHLTANFQLRLVLVDASGHRTSLYDVTPRPYIHLDGFEAQPSFRP